MNSTFYNLGLNLNKMEIIQQYIDIDFADICDYIEFGTEEVMTKDGSLVRIEFARLKVDMIEAHPVPIKEIVANGDKINIKLHDKIKALDKLSRYMPTLMYEEYERKYEAAEILCEIVESDIDKIENGWMREDDFYNKFESIAKDKFSKT